MADLVPRETLPPTEAADSDSNWTETKLGKLAAGVVLTVEGLPFTNEAARFAVLGLAIKYGDPAMAAVAYGATTMAIEGSGAVVAADLIDSDSGSKAVAGMQKVLSKAGVDNLRTNLPTEALIAFRFLSSLLSITQQDTQKELKPRKRQTFELT